MIATGLASGDKYVSFCWGCGVFLDRYSLTLLEVPKARSSAHDGMSEQLINCYPDKGNSTVRTVCPFDTLPTPVVNKLSVLMSARRFNSSQMMINNGSSTSGSNPDDDDCKPEESPSQSQSQADPQSTPPEAELVNTGWLEIGYRGWPVSLKLC